MAKASRFLPVLCDGSTDVSVHEQEVSYLRAAAKGVVTVKMLGIQRVARPNAQSIHKAIADFGNADVRELCERYDARHSQPGRS